MKTDWYEVEVKYFSTLPVGYEPDPDERRYATARAALRHSMKLREELYGVEATRIVHVQRKVVNKRKIKEEG